MCVFQTQNLNYLDCIRILSLPQPNGSSLHFIFPLCLQQDDEINQQSQLIEKLKQQMLDQEEVMGGGTACEERGLCSSLESIERTSLPSDGRRGILLGFSHPKTMEVCGLNWGFA